MNRKELDILRITANQNITKVFDFIGMNYQERYQYIVAPCPIHGGDRRDAFSWHVDLGLYQCFSQSCHEQYGKDVFGLVKGALGCTFPEAVNHVKNLFKDVSLQESEINQIMENKKFVVSSFKEKEKKTYPEDCLKKLKYHNYLESRGYPKELIESYQAGITSSKYKKMSNRVIFPVRDVDGTITGFSGRTLDDKWKEKGIPKWMHSEGFNKEKSLFNIDKAKYDIESTGIAIITEGILDVLRLEQAGIHNSVAIFGTKLHNGQIAQLLAVGASTLIIALDSDNAGSLGVERAILTAKSYFDIKVFKPTNAKDVGDMSIEQIRKELSNLQSYCRN